MKYVLEIRDEQNKLVRTEVHEDKGKHSLAVCAYRSRGFEKVPGECIVGKDVMRKVAT